MNRNAIAHAGHGLLNGVLVGVAVGVVLGLAAMAAWTAHLDASSAPTYAQHLERHFGCWTGDAPADMHGKLPGGVIVRRGSTAERHESSDRAVGAALDHVFEGEHPGLTVLAFCRR